jgi:hypothetical protein
MFSPGSATFNAGAGVSGANAAWLAEGWLGQNPAVTFQPGTYTLTAALGIANLPRFVTPYSNAPINGIVNDPTFLPASNDPTSLRMIISWGFQGPEISARTVQRSAVVPGTFSDFSTVLVVHPGDNIVGRSLAIAFNEGSGDLTYFAIDNVRLTFIPTVPEPATWMLLVAGILFLFSSLDVGAPAGVRSFGTS